MNALVTSTFAEAVVPAGAAAVSPVYWKPKYGSRRMRERAFARRELAREQALRRRPRSRSLLARLRARLRR